MPYKEKKVKLKLLAAYLCYFAVIAIIVTIAISAIPPKNQPAITKHNLKNGNANDLTGATVADLMDTVDSKENDPQKANASINQENVNQKYVILTFDDGWSSQYQAYKMLKLLKGTLYISSSLIGKKDRLTLDNLTEMYSNGWDIANHTVNHVNLTKVSLKKAKEEIYGCSAWIVEQGFTRDMAFAHLAYPEGGYNSDIIEVLKKQGVLTARTTNAGNDTSNLLELGRTSLHGMTKKNIRDLMLSDEKILILSFHRLIPDNSTSIEEIDLKLSYFKVLIDSIYESKRKVLTLTEWYNIGTRGYERHNSCN